MEENRRHAEPTKQECDWNSFHKFPGVQLLFEVQLRMSVRNRKELPSREPASAVVHGAHAAVPESLLRTDRAMEVIKRQRRAAVVNTNDAAFFCNTTQGLLDRANNSG